MATKILEFIKKFHFGSCEEELSKLNKSLERMCKVISTVRRELNDTTIVKQYSNMCKEPIVSHRAPTYLDMYTDIDDIKGSRSYRYNSGQIWIDNTTKKMYLCIYFHDAWLEPK